MGTRSRREREKTQRRKAIIQAAEKIFFEKGFQATTIQEISDKTELSKGTIYLYFKSKDELFFEVCMSGIEAFRDYLEEKAKREKSPEAKVKAVYMAYIEYSLNQPHIFRVLQDTFNDRVRRNLSAKTIENINRLLVDAMVFGAGLVQECIDAGKFRKDLDPYLFAVMCWRMATGLVDLALLGDPGMVKRETLDLMFEESIDLLMEGARAKQ